MEYRKRKPNIAVIFSVMIPKTNSKTNFILKHRS